MQFRKRRLKGDGAVPISEWLDPKVAKTYVTRAELVNVNTIMLDTFRDRYLWRYKALKWLTRWWKSIRRDARELGDIAKGRGRGRGD